MAIHHIDVDEASTCPQRGGDLVAELGEVSTEDRGSDRDPRGEREPGVAHWPTLADAPLACDCL